MLDAVLLEGVDEGAELSDFEPGDVVDRLGEGGIGFVFEGDGDEVLDPCASCALSDHEGEGATSCDET